MSAPTRTRAVSLLLDPGSPNSIGMPSPPAGLVEHDLYDLPELDLGSISGINLASSCDQVFLGRHRDLLEDFVRSGGRLLVNGHVAEPFLTGLVPWRRLSYKGPRDLEITSLSPHPIWEGIDLRDVLYRTGVPGPHSFEELERIGVAGFYGRGYHLPLPESGRAINGVGPLQAPIDYTYPLGSGEVVVHGGVDLITFVDPHRTTARLGENILGWLEGTA
ncbi:hypothetical protein SAMN05443637_102244 [Pseudonocardia thermophila]|jgi:hypothetical protein|uniref:Uncharacterized protein n=1 Tax=Pseudonocardia thermophila TaxID=1848 RepID=A0A1M6PFU4_PSETH|nr:hypothetical protein [Pseudonocardia thermophila]SHK06791.1 hypothetical protein SAMN05443637_102244 [Pseudonocardia thermophila]